MVFFDKFAVTCACPPTRCQMICSMSADNQCALQAHSRGLFDKNMTSLGVDPASPSGTTHSAAPPHRESVITHATSRSAPEAAAPAPGGLAATPETASMATPISRTAPATPGMTPTTAKTTTPKTITPKTTTPKTAANTSTGVAISAEAHGTPSEGTLQAAGGASMSVPPPGTGTPIVPTKTELLPGTVSTTILTSATTGPSVVPSARTAHSAVAGAAIGKLFLWLSDLIVFLPADLFVSYYVCVSVSTSQHAIMSCILCTVQRS